MKETRAIRTITSFKSSIGEVATSYEMGHQILRFGFNHNFEFELPYLVAELCSSFNTEKYRVENLHLCTGPPRARPGPGAIIENEPFVSLAGG